MLRLFISGILHSKQKQRQIDHNYRTTSIASSIFIYSLPFHSYLLLYLFSVSRWCRSSFCEALQSLLSCEVAVANVVKASVCVSLSLKSFRPVIGWFRWCFVSRSVIVRGDVAWSDMWCQGLSPPIHQKMKKRIPEHKLPIQAFLCT
jgi:hypothetical protein